MKPTKTSRKLNVRLLRRIQKHILEEPKRLVMSRPIIRADSQAEWENVAASDASKTIPPCGTAACIAGWAILLTRGVKYEPQDSISEAAAALGVENTWDWTTHTLFFVPQWPEPFNLRYNRAKTPKARAKVAAARIEHLIKSGE